MTVARAVDDVHRRPHDRERVLPGVRARRPPRSRVPCRRPTLGAQASRACSASASSALHAPPGPRARRRRMPAPIVVHAVTGPRARAAAGTCRRFLPTVGAGALRRHRVLVALVARHRGGRALSAGSARARAPFDVVASDGDPEVVSRTSSPTSCSYVAVAPVVAAAVVVGLGLSARAPRAGSAVRVGRAPDGPGAMLGQRLRSSARPSTSTGPRASTSDTSSSVVPLLLRRAGARGFESGLPRPRRLGLGDRSSRRPARSVVVPVDRLRRTTAEFQSLALLPWQSITPTGLALAACVAGFTGSLRLRLG